MERMQTEVGFSADEVAIRWKKVEAEEHGWNVLAWPLDDMPLIIAALRKAVTAATGDGVDWCVSRSDLSGEVKFMLSEEEALRLADDFEKQLRKAREMAKNKMN